MDIGTRNGNNNEERNALRVEAIRFMEFLQQRDNRTGGLLYIIWIMCFIFVVFHFVWTQYIKPELVEPLRHIMTRLGVLDQMDSRLASLDHKITGSWYH